MLRRSGGSTNGNGLDVAEAERGHLQDDRGEVGAQDLRVGELRAGPGSPPRSTAGSRCRRDAAAPAGALVGRGLRDRLDRQPLHLQSLAVAGDARGARVDDVADARHGQRGLGDVGGQHDAPAAVRGEDPVLLGGRQPGVQRQDLGDPVELDGRRSASAVSRISRSPERNTRTSPGRLGGQQLARRRRRSRVWSPGLGSSSVVLVRSAPSGR